MSEFKFLSLGAIDHGFFTFGHPREKGSYKSYLLYDPVSESFDVWSTNKWTHLCLSFESSTSFIRMTKVAL